MNNYSIKNVGDPENNQDVVTKNYYNNNLLPILNQYSIRVNGSTNSTSYVQIGNLNNGPINLITTFIESDYTGYQLYRNKNIFIYPNYANSWNNYYYYLQAIGYNNNNQVILFNGNENSGIGDGYFALQISYNIVYMKVYNSNYNIRYYIN